MPCNTSTASPRGVDTRGLPPCMAADTSHRRTGAGRTPDPGQHKAAGRNRRLRRTGNGASRQPRPMLGRFPWFALLRRSLAFLRLVFFDIGALSYAAPVGAPTARRRRRSLRCDHGDPRPSRCARRRCETGVRVEFRRPRRCRRLRRRDIRRQTRRRPPVRGHAAPRRSLRLLGRMGLSARTRRHGEPSELLVRHERHEGIHDGGRSGRPPPLMALGGSSAA